VSRLLGFPPAGAVAPRVLILGSFPSAASLEAAEYYAHDRNHFWALLGLILGFDPRTPYQERITRLASSGIALWDILGECEREGSLDRDIRLEEANPLGAYIESRPTIGRIALNGGKAASSFLAHAAPELARGLGRGGFAMGETLRWRPPFAPDREILVSRLPSSSPVPTRAFRRALDKLPAWSAFLSFGEPDDRPRLARGGALG
jgi:double-stranded uracil-DNA glycosylase